MPVVQKVAPTCRNTLEERFAKPIQMLTKKGMNKYARLTGKVVVKG